MNSYSLVNLEILAVTGEKGKQDQEATNPIVNSAGQVMDGPEATARQVRMVREAYPDPMLE